MLTRRQDERRGQASFFLFLFKADPPEGVEEELHSTHNVNVHSGPGPARRDGCHGVPFPRDGGSPRFDRTASRAARCRRSPEMRAGRSMATLCLSAAENAPCDPHRTGLEPPGASVSVDI